MKTFQILTSSFFFALLLLNGGVCAQDLNPEEIVSKHTASLGTPQALSKIRNVVATGSARFRVLRSPVFTKGVESNGRLVIMSERPKLFLGAKFDSRDYAFEEITYNGGNVDTAFIQPGMRSVLGNFVHTNPRIVSEGLLAGPLSVLWPFYDWSSSSSSGKLRSGGRKKIDGRETSVVNYQAAGGSPFATKLYFDNENFELLRIEYERVIPPPISSDPRESVSQVPTVQKFTQTFSKYKKVNGLNMPFSYKITLLQDGSVTNEFEWNIDFSEFLFNEKLDATTFDPQK